MPPIAACPRCGVHSEWHGNPWRPFCSERCKTIDFGAWLDEQHRIRGEPADIPDDDTEKH